MNSDPFLEIGNHEDNSSKSDYLNPSKSMADTIFAQGAKGAVTFSQLPWFAKPSARLIHNSKGCYLECPYEGCGGEVVIAIEEISYDICCCATCESVFGIRYEVPEKFLIR